MGRKRREKFKPTCGVYYLWNEIDGVVYVGASVNVEGRIAGHMREGEKDFCGFWVDECEASELGEKEGRAIAELYPKYNYNVAIHWQWLVGKKKLKC